MFERQTHLETSSQDNKLNEINYYYGVVVDNIDPIDSRRLRVRIKGIDDKSDDTKLPWCTSFLPLTLITSPKIGELVKVFFPSKLEVMNKREWLGPILSSFNTLEFESARSAQSNQDVSNIAPRKNLKKTPSTGDAYINNKDVGIQGRENADLVFKNKEVLIRAGKFVFNDKTKANTKNPTYIQLKLSKDGQTSYSTMVADKICLISHGGTKTVKTLIDENELKKIIANCFSAAYAEPIMEFCKLMQDFVANHIHPQNLRANPSYGKINEIVSFDINKFIAKNIKIN